MPGEVNLNSLMPCSSILWQNREQGKQSKDLLGNFSKVLGEALSKVNNLRKESDILTQKLVTGEIDNVHEMMIASQKAEVALTLAMEIRNKVIQAYDKIMMMH